MAFDLYATLIHVTGTAVLVFLISFLAMISFVAFAARRDLVATSDPTTSAEGLRLGPLELATRRLEQIEPHPYAPFEVLPAMPAAVSLLGAPLDLVMQGAVTECLARGWLTLHSAEATLSSPWLEPRDRTSSVQYLKATVAAIDEARVDPLCREILRIAKHGAASGAPCGLTVADLYGALFGEEGLVASHWLERRVSRWATERGYLAREPRRLVALGAADARPPTEQEAARAMDRRRWLRHIADISRRFPELWAELAREQPRRRARGASSQRVLARTAMGVVVVNTILAVARLH